MKLKPKNIKELIAIALSNNNQFAEFSFSKLPAFQSKILEKLIGIKLVGVERVIDTNGIKHTLVKHGSDLAEQKRGQVGVVIDDFSKIPLIVKEPDSIEYAGKNRLKQDVVLYKKKIGDVYFVAEAVKVASAGNKLVFQTMYKKKKKTN